MSKIFNPDTFFSDSAHKSAIFSPAQVAESFRLRKKSEKLLSSAKSAVELAIDCGEDVAIKSLVIT